MKATIATTCGNRLSHLESTLASMVSAASESDYDCEVLVVDYGPTRGVAELVVASEGIRRVEVTETAWNFGKARNAALNAARGEIFINCDCDTYITAEGINSAIAWLEKQGQRSFIRNRNARGVHGRCAFFKSELIEIGGFHEEGLDGAEHVMGSDMADVYHRADIAGFSFRNWPGRVEFIDHEIDKEAACAAGWPLRDEVLRRMRKNGRARSGRKIL